MRIRYRAPAGPGTLTLPDSTTVADVYAQVAAETGLKGFALRYGWPTQALDASLGTSPAADFGLNGETLTVVPEEAAPAPAPAPASARDAAAVAAPTRNPAPAPAAANAPLLPSTRAPEDITPPGPARAATLLVRVMPSDNSCLFTAFGGALQDQPPAAVMRQKIADYIHAHPDEYTEAILGMPPLECCTKITSPHYWGGAIEISIFSNIFDVEICTYDVKEKNLMRFGEHKSARCILVYSGIHYDRVAFSPSEPPYRVSLLPPEIDRTLWDTTDDAILAQTHRLVEKLHEIHYYTDPSEILLRCDHPGCDWIGSGESMGQRHARETGHHSLSEIDDTQDDKDGGMILRCQHAGCDWLGGIQAAKTHATDTGHTKTAIIPDF